MNALIFVKHPALMRVLLGLTLCLALGATIFGCKLNLIDHFGSELPFWDQWDGEADLLYRPYVTGELKPSALIAPHNEHRILLTRLLALAIFEANQREWDARLQMVINAGLHTFVCILILCFIFQTLDSLFLALPVAGIAVLFFSSDLSWENTLAGFQSPFYFYLLFSLMHLAVTLRSRPFSGYWWLSPLAGVAALFSTGSGFFSALAILAAVALKIIRERRVELADFYILATNASLGLAGLFLRVEVPHHAILKAASFKDGVIAWSHQLTWPITPATIPALAILGLVPLLLLLVSYVYRRQSSTALLLIAVGVWSLLQTMGIAYARGGANFGYSARYADILAVVVVGNLLSIAWMIKQETSPVLRPLWTGLIGVSLGLAVGGFIYEHTSIQQYLREQATFNDRRIHHVRAYLNAPSPDFLKLEPYIDLPYPSATRLAGLLDNPSIRSFLPGSIRPPIELEPDSASHGFSENLPVSSNGPRLDGLNTWSASAGLSAAFISRPFPTDRSLISLWVSGADQTSPKIQLVRMSDQQAFNPLGQVPRITGKWTRLNFHAPPGKYHLEVRKNAGGQLSFTQPILTTPLSQLARKFSRNGQLFITGGWILAAVSAFFLLRLRRSSFSTAPNPMGAASIPTSPPS